MMRVGLGIVTHNRLSVIRECIQSALAQGPDYIVIVDNNSESETKDFLLSIKALHSELKIIFNSENRFPGFARNQIVTEFKDKTDLIVFHDGDVIINKDCFRILKTVFSGDPTLCQLTPLSIPPVFQKKIFSVNGINLCEPISCCSGCMTAIPTSIFKSGLAWRETIWNPLNNQEIGEDYFLSRDILRKGKKIAWLATQSPFTSHHLGREPDVVENNFEYYVETFGRRGMLSRLKDVLPGKSDSIELLESKLGYTEIHGRFTPSTTQFNESLLTLEQKKEYYVHYKNHINLYQSIKNQSVALDTAKLDLIRNSRNYFDAIEEGHPFFSQKTLQAALFFNDLYIKYGGVI